MTISSSTTAPLFVVVGSTGVQGTSVIKAIEASPISYRVRGITRDTSNPKAEALSKRGVELIAADVSKKAELETAFEGATYVFAMTTPLTGDEIQFGKNQLDASKAVGAKIGIWAGLSSLSDFTNGQYPCSPFDNKAKVTAYARTITTPSFRVIDVQPPGYLSNYWTRARPVKGEDGTYLMTHAQSPTSLCPIVDMDEDYGEYVIGAIERGAQDLDTVFAAPEYTSREHHAAVFSKVLGKPVKAIKVEEGPFKAAFENMPNGKIYGDLLYNMYQAIEKVGYWNGADLAASNAILRRPARNFEEGVIANKHNLEPLYQ